MDRQDPFIGENEHDHLEEIASTIGPDCKLLRRVAAKVEIDHDERMIDRVPEVVVTDAMPTGGAVDLHTSLV